MDLVGLTIATREAGRDNRK